MESKKLKTSSSELFIDDAPPISTLLIILVAKQSEVKSCFGWKKLMRLHFHQWLAATPQPSH
jgi:hypothetical protein